MWENPRKEIRLLANKKAKYVEKASKKNNTVEPKAAGIQCLSWIFLSVPLVYFL